MPHLFMISDEFAELKSEQPDFMDELISTARIGRSLGVHLILATQKPAGVVNDQIWSNSNFKISLKVSDKSDSMEVLKTPDAASITLPGRAYLEVGNNEMYELFQSAYSGADYRPDEDDSNQSFLIKKINKMGQQQVISQDLSGLDETGHVEKVPTQLEAVVNKVHDLFEESGAKPLAQPWLPPLRERIFVSELRKLETNENQKDLTVTIGQVDVPSEQDQRPVEINISEDGNIGLYAAAGYGKSTFLQTMVMELARKNTPGKVNFYLLDFGTNGLMPLRNLPHVADLIGLGEDEKIRKFIKRINRLMKERQAMLGKHSVANIEMYQQMTGEIIPEVMVVIDNFDGINDTRYGEQFLNTMVKMTRDGNSLGIHLIASASSVRAMHSTLLNNIKRRIALKQNSDDDLYQLLGKTRITIDDVPGRGLMMLDEVRLFQTALPVEGKDDVEVISNLRNEVDQINKDWVGSLPDPIPMMKDELPAEEFFARKDVQEALANQKLPIGLDYEDVEAVVYDPEEHGNMVLAGGAVKKFKPLLNQVEKSLENLNNSTTVVIDSSGIVQDKNQFSKVITEMPKANEFLNKLTDTMDKRLGSDEMNFDWIYVYITDSEKFISKSGVDMVAFEKLIKNSIDAHIAFIIAGDNQAVTVSRINDGVIYHKYIKTLAFTVRRQDQKLIEAPYNMNEIELDQGNAYFEAERQFIKIKLIEEE